MRLGSILCGLILFSVVTSGGCSPDGQVHKMTVVSLSNVEVADEFWSPRIETNQKVGIRHTFKVCDHSLKNFDKAAGIMEGEHQGTCASDSDVYKIIEGAAYSLHHNPDSELEDFVDKLIDRIIAAQQEDGYLYTFYTVNNETEAEKKWDDFRSRHQLYCMGHFIEAAVAYYEVTGKRKLLDAAIRLADLIDSIFGVGKRYAVPGHQEIELALVRLYRVTGQKRYLDLAKFFLDERGYAHGTERKPFDYTKAEKLGNKWLNRNGIMQDHKPIIEQLEPTGHAVRAGYMYSAMIDVAGNIDSPGYVNALDHIWNDVVKQRLYITGGVGSAQFHDEGFGQPYKLPNEKAYCETCAAMAFVFWNHRMNLLHGEAKYIDVMELSLYNGAISGISLSGDRFFYRNPLEVKGKYQRREWFEPGCCPSNAVRFLPQVGKYIYTKDDNNIYVNLFVGNKADIVLGNNNVKLTQTTRYPWDGKIKIVVDPEETAKFGMNIRIPGWSVGKPLPSNLYRFAKNQGKQQPVSLKLNGKYLQKFNNSKGYAQINRKWNKGDIIELDLPMPIRRVCGHPKLEDAAGCAVLMRGPLVYCLEEADNSEYFREGNEAYLSSEADSFKSEYQVDLLGGVVAIKGEASLLTKPETIEITAVPYYSWCNREAGKMRVWLPCDAQ
ncbi:MAG: glycoside hydrolase family 127 protein [Candidatus Brocadiia bacterium]|nr:MAG: glycoside hydrolase family 127 protein [Candidatus Brocadiia bacterium]